MDNEEKAYFEEFLRKILSNVNSHVDITKDFAGYANRNSFGGIVHNFATILNKVIDESEPNWALSSKIKDFHTSSQIGIQEALTFDGLYQYTNGWPIFNENWSSEDSYWIKTLGLLSAMGIYSVLEYKVFYKDNHRVINVTMVEPFFTRMLSKNRETIINRLSQLGVNESEYNKIIKNIMTTINEIVCIVPDIYDFRVRRNITQTTEQIRNRTEFNYVEYFETCLGQPLNEDDVFHLKYPNCGMDYLSCLSQLEPRSLSNYLLLQSSKGFKKDSTILILTNATIKYFEPLIVAIAFNKYFTESHYQKRNEVLRRFVKHFEDNKDDYSASIHDQVKYHTKSIEPLLEFMNVHLSYEEIIKQYENLDINPNDFYQNVMNIIKHGPTPSSKEYYKFILEDNSHKRSIDNLLLNSIRSYKAPIIYYFMIFTNNLFTTVIELPEINDTERLPIDVDYDDVVKCLDEYIAHIPEFCDEDSWYDFLVECIWIRICQRLTMKQYKDWLNDNENIAKEQSEILKLHGLDHYKLFCITFTQTNHILEIILNHFYIKDAENFGQI